MTHEAIKSADVTRRDALLAGYRPSRGVYDEMVDVDGRVRPHWSAMVDRLAAEGPQALAQRFTSADRYLKESGVYYRVYADSAASERHWPLAHVPLLITPKEWKGIEAGAIQRARLLESLLAKAYDGRETGGVHRLPAALIAGSPDFLRPLVHSEGRVPRQLHIYAIDLGRSPAGAWWVLRDRTQAPSGAGYALENRIAMSRAMSDVFRAFEVQRLAPFFDALRAELASHREPDDAGVCLLTPGPLNETYFEHSYLARYLGLRLVEGVDLLVLGGQVYLRTIGGLRKVRVLLRRIDGDFADPLELNARSQLGVAGLVQAVRRGNVTLANALGSGLAEARGLLSFLPALAEPLLGEGLKLPNVATWWCGQPAERESVLDALDDRVIAPAFSRISSGIPPGGPWVMSEQGPAAREALREAILRRGIDFVGQEVVKLSTTPVWVDGRLEPHPFTFRVFVAAVGNSYRVMPGGFALIAPQGDPRAITMQRGARAADVWVTSDGPVEPATLLPSEKQIVVGRATGVLPSRAADNLFWLARYIERAEATLRLIRSLAARVSEQREQDRPDVAGIAELLLRWGASSSQAPAGDLTRTAHTALSGCTLEGAVPTLVAAARRAAFVVRDRFPPDAWRALDDLNAYVMSAAATEATDAAVFDKASTALRIIAAVTGFQLENMNRLSGWRFLKLGLRIERALATCRYARQFARAQGGSRQELDLLLELNDCQITYRARYPLGAAFAPVMDLVLLDDSNPRSLLFQLSRLRDHAAALPLLPPSNRPTPALAVSDRLLATVSAFEPARIRGDDILGLENGLMHLSDEISLSFFRVRDPVVADGSGS